MAKAKFGKSGKAAKPRGKADFNFGANVKRDKVSPSKIARALADYIGGK